MKTTARTATVAVAAVAVAVIVAAALVARLGDTGPGDDERAYITVVGTWANLSLYEQREFPFWNDTVPEKSNGAITTKVRAYTELGLQGDEVIRLMGQGVIEFGSTVLGYVAGEDPENEAADLAGFSSDIAVAREVSEAWKPALADLYEEKHGIRLLAVYPFHAQAIYCKTPISSLGDLRGKKVRTFSKSLSEFVEAAGGTGVNIPFAEVVPALQKGVADCAITGALSGNSARWFEVTEYLYALPVGWGMVMHGVNLDAWNRLPPQTRAFLEKEIAVWENQIWDAAALESSTGIACNTGGECVNGNKAEMTLVPVSDADKARLREIMETVIVPKWAKRCGEECVAKWNDTVGRVVGITASAN